MRKYIKNNGITDVTVIKAAKGKVLRRKEDGYMAGDELWLGMSYYHLVDGENTLREEPLLELPEHYEEIDEPEPEIEAETEDGSTENSTEQ